jgi:large subunit ribosomal protein L18
VRRRIKGDAQRPRLAVFKSLRYVYAQVIDDRAGRTVAAASSLEPGIKEALKGSCGDRAAARLVGSVVAERAREAGIRRVVFDRGGYIYHGRVRELAEAAREKGLEF